MHETPVFDILLSDFVLSIHVTFTEILDFPSSVVAVIVAVPSPFAVTLPFSTVAIDSLSLFHVTAVPSGVTVTSIFFDYPIFNEKSS